MPEERKPVNAPVKEGEVLSVKIDAIGQKGDGIVKIEGYTIIIPGAKMDEELRIKILRTLPRYAFAEKVS